MENHSETLKKAARLYFVVQLRRTGGVIFRSPEFFAAKAQLLSLEARGPFGSYQLGIGPLEGPFEKACRGCGKQIAHYKARCLVCSAMGLSQPTGSSRFARR